MRWYHGVIETRSKVVSIAPPHTVIGRGGGASRIAARVEWLLIINSADISPCNPDFNSFGMNETDRTIFTLICTKYESCKQFFFKYIIFDMIYNALNSCHYVDKSVEECLHMSLYVIKTYVTRRLVNRRSLLVLPEDTSVSLKVGS